MLVGLAINNCGYCLSQTGTWWPGALVVWTEFVLFGLERCYLELTALVFKGAWSFLIANKGRETTTPGLLGLSFPVDLGSRCSFLENLISTVWSGKARSCLRGRCLRMVSILSTYGCCWFLFRKFRVLVGESGWSREPILVATRFMGDPCCAINCWRFQEEGRSLRCIVWVPITLVVTDNGCAFPVIFFILYSGEEGFMAMRHSQWVLTLCTMPVSG